MNIFSLKKAVINQVPHTFGITIKKSAYFVLVLGILIVYSGCAGLSSPSDEEVTKLVTEHYLFYNDGEDVKVRIVDRREYNNDCNCYPIKFYIDRSRASDGTKTFFFFKNGSGKFHLKKYARAVKT